MSSILLLFVLLGAVNFLKEQITLKKKSFQLAREPPSTANERRSDEKSNPAPESRNHYLVPFISFCSLHPTLSLSFSFSLCLSLPHTHTHTHSHMPPSSFLSGSQHMAASVFLILSNLGGSPLTEEHIRSWPALASMFETRDKIRPRK